MKATLGVFDVSANYNNERSLQFIFSGQVPNFEFQDFDLWGQSPAITNSTVGSPDDLWWMPIPYEFIYQEVDTTQVILTSNGQEGLCLIDACNFEYVDNS